MTELEASGSPEADVSGASSTSSSTTTDANPAAGSSTEAPKGVETTLLDRVRSALGQPGSETSPISEGGSQNAPPKPAGSESQDELPADIQALSPKAQNRYRELVSQRKEADERAQAVEAELKPKAEKLDVILTYMERHRIEPQEFDNALEVTRLVKSGDFQKALEVLTPIYREVADRAGRILPADLQERVRLGYITKEDAEKLHQASTRAKNLESQTSEERQRNAEEAANREAQRVVGLTTQTADDWAKAKASSDPDWHLKADAVAKEVELDLMRRQAARDPNWFPQTAKEVVERAEAALKVVEAQFKRIAPRPRAKTVATGQPASPRSAAAPKTLLDAVKGALNG